MSTRGESSHTFTRILVLMALVTLLIQGIRMSEIRARLDKLEAAAPKVEKPATPVEKGPL